MLKDIVLTVNVIGVQQTKNVILWGVFVSAIVDGYCVKCGHYQEIHYNCTECECNCHDG